MQSLTQSPTAARFVQNPYPFYERARALGPIFHWSDYDLPCTTSHTAINAILRDRRFGRECPPALRPAVPEHLRPFYAVEDHSMLELEPPHHTRLRGLVLRAFTSRRIATLAPEIEAIAHQLIDALPEGECDLIAHFCRRLPMLVIARLIGIPEPLAPEVERWSSAMVGMYQAGRSRQTEERAAAAAAVFAEFLRLYIGARRRRPADDLLTHLIQAEAEGERLSTDEVIATCILILNAGHEAAVHAIGNAVKTLLETETPPEALSPPQIGATVEELLRYDPPLHLFKRYVYADAEIMGHSFRAGGEVALLLAAANRDPGAWHQPQRFLPARPEKAHLSFSAGLHFCLGAPLARLEMAAALPVLFGRRPGLRLIGKPRYANTYHFRGLERLMVA